MRIDRFTYIRVSKTRFLVIDNRLHLVYASCDVETRARNMANLLNSPVNNDV